MKTVIIYDQFGQDDLKFYVVDGDKKHLDGVYINSSDCSDVLIDELSELFYDKESGREIMVGTTKFPAQEVIDGAIVIVAGFLP